jgi:hypothetical protein
MILFFQDIQMVIYGGNNLWKLDLYF